MQKGHNFWQFKDHKSGRRHENQTNDLNFFICFSSPNSLGNSFFNLKIVKIHFHGVPHLAHSSLQNTWILEMKAVRLGFSPVLFRKYTHSGKQKTRFYFFYQVENKFQNFQGNLMVYINVKTHVFPSEFCEIFKNTSGCLLLYLSRNDIIKADVKEIRKVCQQTMSHWDHSRGFNSIFDKLRMLECSIALIITSNIF